MPTTKVESATATPMGNQLANEQKTGEETGLPPRTLRDLRARGLIPYYKIGRLVRYDVCLVRAALAKNCLIEAKPSRSTGKGSK